MKRKASAIQRAQKLGGDPRKDLPFSFPWGRSPTVSTEFVVRRGEKDPKLNLNIPASPTAQANSISKCR